MLRIDLNSEREFWGSGDGFKPAKPKPSKRALHPSEEAIARQVRHTREIQRNLSDALDDIESCRSAAQQKILAVTVFNLYKKAEHLSFIVGILEKFDKELKFFRKKLEAVKENKASEAVAHRIQWLEKCVITLVDKNSPDKLDDLLQLPKLPEKKKKVQPQRKDQDHSAGTSLLSKTLFLTELPPATPKSILHLSSELSIPTQAPPIKKAVTLATVPSVSEFEPKPDQDAADAYWMSGHHRFSYLENKDILMKENPVSLHYLGLAVPANFVPQTSADYLTSATLPWQTEQDVSKGNFDIMRDDLERVLRRTRRIQDKVWQAANLSVEFGGHEDEDEDASENRQTVAMRRLHSRGSTRDMRKLTSRGTTAVSLRSESMSVASLQRSSRDGSSSSTASSSGTYLSGGVLGGLHGNTKDVIPLTRTNMSKQYPHSCDRWTDARPDPNTIFDQPPIANQRNLYNQTKIRLFIPKRGKKRPSVRRDLITPNSVASNRSFRKVGTGIRFIEKLKSSGGEVLSQLQKDRLDDLLENAVASSNDEDRAHASKALSFLGIADTDRTIPVLTGLVSNDVSPIVRFKSSKALLNLGQWVPKALEELTLHLLRGNIETKLDVLEQISCTSNVRSIYLENCEMAEMRRLIKVMKKLAVSPDTDEEVSFQCGVCLGEICGVFDEKAAKIAQKKLRNTLMTSTDWTTRAQSLEVLVRRLNFCDDDVFKTIVKHLQRAPKWKDRLAAALLIGFLGPVKLETIIDEESVYQILRQKLWDDSKRDVRLGVSQALTSLGMRSRLLEDLDQSLRDSNEDVRSQAVISMSAAGIRSDITLRFLVEMLGLDSSDYVRLQVIRTFQALGVTDIRVVRAVRERDRAGGPLARAARRYLSAFDLPLMSAQTSRQHRGEATPSVEPRSATRGTMSWPTLSRGSNILTRESTRSKGPAKGSKRPSFSMQSDRDLLGPPKLEVISTAVRKSSIRSLSESIRSYGKGGLLASASSFW